MKIIDTIDCFIPGDWGNETLSEEAPCKVSCIRGADIVPIENNDFSHIPTRYINQKSFDTKCLQAGDIIVEKSGGSPTQSTGRVSFVSQELIDTVGSVVCSNFCVAFRVKQGWNPLYIYYYLQHVYNNGVFFNFEGKTSGIKNLQLEAAYNAIPIEDVDKAIQDSVVAVLDRIQKKMTINSQINQNLEALAKQLYDSWFVQFDFPNEEGKPYKSSGGKMVWNDKLKREIPEGWFASSICKIAYILSGGTPSKAVAEYWENGVIPFFGPTDCNGNVFQIETADHITQKGLDHCASSLFEEGTIIITARGSIGKLVVVGTPMAMNQSCYALQPKEGEYEYLYFLTIQLIECLKAKGSGSVFKSIIASDIEASLLCIASAETITQFCKRIKPIMLKIKQNIIEISELTKQRDELLPLLMNGQVSLNSDLSHG